MKISSALHEYLFHNPKYRIEVKQREYDGKFNVTRPYIDVHDNSGLHSITWETVGVFNSEKEANTFLRNFLKR